MRFVLVHGGWHGPWCWDGVAGLLRRAGHGVCTPELPVDDPAAGLAAYADVVGAALRDDSGPTVLVGHSLAGLVLPVVAAGNPHATLVYLCALLPRPGLSWSQQIERGDAPYRPDYERARPDAGPDGLSRLPPEVATAFLHDDCTPEVAGDAVPRLRPQGTRIAVDVCPLPALPGNRAHWVLGRDDLAVDPGWSRAAGARAGATVVELPTGHSPFLSRPDAVAGLLADIAATP